MKTEYLGGKKTKFSIIYVQYSVKSNITNRADLFHSPLLAAEVHSGMLHSPLLAVFYTFVFLPGPCRDALLRGET